MKIAKYLFFLEDFNPCCAKKYVGFDNVQGDEDLKKINHQAEDEQVPALVPHYFQPFDVPGPVYLFHPEADELPVVKQHVAEEDNK
jgi:hypothetical protein